MPGGQFHGVFGGLSQRFGAPSAVTVVLFGRRGAWLCSVPSPHPKSQIPNPTLVPPTTWGHRAGKKLLNYLPSGRKKVLV